MHTKNKPSGDLIGKLLNGRLGGLRVFNQFDDLRECCVFANAGRAELKGSRLVYRPPITSSPAFFSMGMLSPVIIDWSIEE